MRLTTAPSHATLAHHAASLATLKAYAEHDLGAAIALGEREARRLRAAYVRQALARGFGRLLAWPGRQVRQALRFSH